MFTISKEADKAIQNDVDIIIGIILQYWEPSAIIMFGGYGHGEGGFKKDQEKFYPVNDYDLYIVTGQAIKSGELERVEKECSRAIDAGGIEIVGQYNTSWDDRQCFHVDLHNLTEGSLSRLYPTQRTADLKTSTVVYGDKNILKQIPDMRISKSDSIRMLFNKLDHFQLAEKNNDRLKQIYAVKGLTDLTSSLLIFYGGYRSKYQLRAEQLYKMDVPEELKGLVKKATESKLCHGYNIDNVESFFEESKKWVKWGLKKILKDHLGIKADSWVDICEETYKKLPYHYFNDYLKSPLLFPAQYYLNIRYYFEAKRKKEFLPGVLLRWRDAGLTIAIALILYSVGENREAEKYLRKLTNDTEPLMDRILTLYSIYYLQKLI
jgi:hypothetical protein